MQSSRIIWLCWSWSLDCRTERASWRHVFALLAIDFVVIELQPKTETYAHPPVYWQAVNLLTNESGTRGTTHYDCEPASNSHLLGSAKFMCSCNVVIAHIEAMNDC